MPNVVESGRRTRRKFNIFVFFCLYLFVTLVLAAESVLLRRLIAPMFVG